MYGTLHTTPGDRTLARLFDADADGDAQAFEPDATEVDIYDLAHTDYADCTVTDVYASIDANIWLASQHRSQGADGLANECLKAAQREYSRFEEIMTIYAGQPLRDRLQSAAPCALTN